LLPATAWRSNTGERDRQRVYAREDEVASGSATTVERAEAAILNRTALTRRLVEGLVHDEAVIAGIGNTNFDLWAAGHRRQNFYMLGSMGLACPIALGVALAQPERGVIALEGDGSILMGLGCLATIGRLRPRNLTLLIMDNGVYQITGGQPTATQDGVDIVAIARGAGLSATWIRDAAHFEALIARRFESGGPVLYAARIDAAPGAGHTVRDPALIRQSFMRGLGTSRGGPLDR
jgi:thiamine pyrophosphate-dependent acetolactate synthase large subunit-like protein